MRRIKVLQLQPSFNVKAHDFADLAEQIVKALPTSRFQVVSAYLTGRPDESGPMSVAEESMYFNFSERDLKGLRLKALWKIYWYCKENSFDVVICNRFKPISVFLILNRLLSIPLCIGIVHGFGDFDRSYRQRQIKRLAGREWCFVGVSGAVRQHLLDYRCGFTKKNTFEITNALDINKAVALQYTRAEARKRLGLKADRTYIGAVGRLVPVKGHAYLIRAFALLKDEYPEAELVIVGEGRDRKILEHEMEVHGLEGRVHLLGFRPDALRFVRAFDIWTMPSISEGLGLALLEGMSGKLPIIASDIPAMRPLIEGAQGLAIPPRDVQRLKAALDNYLGISSAERERLGLKAFEYLLRKHDINAYRSRYLKLIEDGLAERAV
ncbi:glycosyltransferase family 4 protein [Pseudomonas sp. OIL-1]|uniref:glycosyltransferase family 4 protein n=1 Tax=Pseudomonas sp. OIL-1 TaxID=2706126 RepID=UPI0013A7936B|nr:glycosyltransferase family 4 protein [Pseudomonas sp. OIL-1]QIB52987.1 glycosyltransferase family 4 protein [Pseudomonas sp. OIL-1]